MQEEKFPNPLASLQEVKQKISAATKHRKFKVKADTVAVEVVEDIYLTDDDLDYINYRLDDVLSSFSYLNERIWDLWRALSDHMNDGHLPKINSAGDMEKVLKILGLDKDYEVQKKVIYASDGSVQKTGLELWKKNS